MAKEFWIGDVQEGAHDGAEVELKGWVKRTRGSNKIRFVVLRDSTGTIQCVAKRETCLLYTSPSPRDGLLSRMPSSA